MQAHESPAEVQTPDLGLTYRFGPYLLDASRRRLLSGTSVKSLPEKPFQILMLLLQANCRVVARQTFFDLLWPDDPVGDANLTQHIFMLRTFLGGGDNDYVVTVPGRGYRFAIPVESKTGLSMKGSCERCGRVLSPTDEAYICSYECTFCAECSEALQRICPNCGGVQERRPKRGAS